MGKKVLASALMAATVLGALAKAADLKPNKDEELKDFAPRVAEGVAKLSDDDFNKLPKAAQDYFNAVAKAVNDDKEIPEPAALKVTKEAAPAKEAKEPAKPKVAERKAAATPAATKAKIKAKGATKKEAKPAKAAKANGNGVQSHSRTEGVAKSVFRAVVKKPAISFEDTVKTLGLKGQEVGGYAWSRWNDARQVMEIVNEK